MEIEAMLSRTINARIIKKFVLAVLIATILLVAVAPVAAAPAKATLPTWHTVARGETLFSIGRHYNINPWAIAWANNLTNPNRIYVGQRIYVPAGPPYQPQSQPCGSYYTVQRGDTLFRIGRTYGVDAWSIARANRIYAMNRINVGQRLFIPCN
jgi:LysM repeat protein